MDEPEVVIPNSYWLMEVMPALIKKGWLTAKAMRKLWGQELSTELMLRLQVQHSFRVTCPIRFVNSLRDCYSI